MEYRFKEIRDNRDLKQVEVAGYMHVSRGGYANIEAEIANIKLLKLFYYCEALNLSMDYVCRLTDINRCDHLIKMATIDKNIMASRLDILEKEQHVNGRKIAKVLGIQNTTYSEYKNPRRKNYMQTLMLKKLAEKYGYSMDWLIGRSNVKEIENNLVKQ